MDIPLVTIQGIELERVSSIKLLGIVVGKKLNWAEYKTNIYNGGRNLCGSRIRDLRYSREKNLRGNRVTNLRSGRGRNL